MVPSPSSAITTVRSPRAIPTATLRQNARAFSRVIGNMKLTEAPPSTQSTSTSLRPSMARSSSVFRALMRKPRRTGRSNGAERGPAGPAHFERRGVLLAALGAEHGRSRARAKVLVDQPAGALGVRGILHPDLGERGFDRQLAGEARGVRVEDAGANAPVGEEVGDKLRLGQVGRGVNPLQKRYDSSRLTPSSRMPERLSTEVYEAAMPRRSIEPRTPTATVVNVVSGMYAGMS